MTEDSPSTDALAELVETRWRRDALPRPVCSCGCGYAAHNTERKSLPCQTGGCKCAAYVLRWHEWREHRVVREAVA